MVLLIALLMVSLLSSASEAEVIGGSCVTPDGRQGTCISILRCPPLKALLVRIASHKANFSELRRSICLLDKEPFVCCPLQTTATTPANPFPPTKTSVVPTKCGFQGLQDRIRAGQPAPIGAWPWMVILRGRVGGRSTWHCGGTLISDRYVLTAAHCVNERELDELEFARIGEHTLRQNPDCTPFSVCAPNPQDIPIERIIKHPSYNSPCKECNDIAILRLSKKATLNQRYVQPICLPINPLEDMGFSEQEFIGKFAWAAGWGTVSGDPRRPKRPDVLHQVQLPVQNLPYCHQQKQSYPDPSMVICAGGGGRDTCQGDSGGPLTLTSKEGSRYFLIGITSKGPQVCGAENTQGLYTNIHHYIDWIISNLHP